MTEADAKAAQQRVALLERLSGHLGKKDLLALVSALDYARETHSGGDITLIVDQGQVAAVRVNLTADTFEFGRTY